MIASHRLIASIPLLCSALLCATSAASAEEIKQDAPQPNFVSETFGEVETKYIFGFTEGSGVGLQGEKEVSIETRSRNGKRGGNYAAYDTKFEYETTPTQFSQLEFSAFASKHNIRNVEDFDNRNSGAFNGLSFEYRYLALERSEGQPFSVTLSVEPEWHRSDENSGERVRNFELETKLAVDAELIPGRAFAAFNVIYEPEYNKTATELEKESNLNLLGAFVFRAAPAIFTGAEVGYMRHYSGYALDHYEGYSLYVGPTFYWQLSHKDFIKFAWSTQVKGHASGDMRRLNLDEYSRQRGLIKLAHEF